MRPSFRLSDGHEGQDIKLFPTCERPILGSRCKVALYMLVDVASTMWPGSEFHASITRLEKTCRLSSNLAHMGWLLQFERVCVSVSS